MKSWKTSLCGVVGAMGTTMAAQDNPTIKAIGGVLAALALALMGLAAKDSNVTGGGSNPTVKN